jgi:hypothetical protein
MQQMMTDMPMGMDTGSEGLGMEMMGFVRQLPLTAILGFFGGQLTEPPEQIVDRMLEQVK